MLPMLAVTGHGNDLSLPDPLESAEGHMVQTREDWEHKRRPEILELFREHVYGYAPDMSGQVHFEVFDEDRNALGDTAVRKQIRVRVASGGKAVRIDVLVYLPSSATDGPVPVFAILNFGGNHTVHADPAIPLPRSHVSEKHSPPAAHRGAKGRRYPIDRIISRGYGLATAYYGDIEPDVPAGYTSGVRALFDSPGPRRPDAWGAVGAWAWGLSRIMDCLERDEEIDDAKVAVAGHSRLGKASLWAGAQDERFSVVIANGSGCTGAALARRRKGETIKAINDRFPHWFCEDYRRYNDRESELPVDQHMLIALMAPRPVYVSSATRDLWADPEGEFLSCVHADPVYSIFGLTGVSVSRMPQPDHALNDGHVAYHVRTGKHDLTEYDWECYLDFTERHWGGDNARRNALPNVHKAHC